MAADGSVIIDVRLDKKSAIADLNALEAQIKRTTQKIGSIEKSLSSALLSGTICGMIWKLPGRKLRKPHRPLRKSMPDLMQGIIPSTVLLVKPMWH